MYKNTGRDTGDADPAREMVSKWFILGKNDSFRDTGDADPARELVSNCFILGQKLRLSGRRDADPARELVSNWFILGQNNVKTTFLVKNTSGKRVTPVPLLSVKTTQGC